MCHFRRESARRCQNEPIGPAQGLTFNPEKTKLMLVTNKRKKDIGDVHMGAKTLDLCESLKYLGITLDTKLNWTNHLTDKIMKSTKILNMARAVVGQKWGLTPSKVYWIYSAMVRPVIAYGGLIWAHAINKTQKCKLEQLQRKCLLAMTHSMRSTPTQGMEWCMGMIPLDLYVQREATKARLRIKNLVTDRWDGITMVQKESHRKWHDKVLSQIPEMGYPTDHQVKGNQYVELVQVPDANYDVCIYTDGSKAKKTGSGWAICRGLQVIREDVKYLGKTSTVFQAEAVAIHDVLTDFLHYNNNGKPRDKTIVLRTDSKSGLQAIQSRDNSSKMIEEIQEVIKAVRRNNILNLEWVKAHADNTGNELADMLAKKGTSASMQGPVPFIPVTQTFKKNLINDFYLREWKIRWFDSHGMNHTKSMAGSPGNLKKLLTWKKGDLNLLNQIITGHCLLAKHMSQWKTDIGNMCLCREEEETPYHVLYRCLRNELERLHWEQNNDSMYESILKYFRKNYL